MSGAIRLPPEVEELFQYSDRDGLLDEEDLEEAGYDRQNTVGGELQTWEKDNTVVRYNTETRSIEDYRQYD